MPTGGCISHSAIGAGRAVASRPHQTLSCSRRHTHLAAFLDLLTCSRPSSPGAGEAPRALTLTVPCGALPWLEATPSRAGPGPTGTPAGPLQSLAPGSGVGQVGTAEALSTDGKEVVNGWGDSLVEPLPQAAFLGGWAGLGWGLNHGESW